MADLTFNTTEGQTIDRELLIAYLNTGESGAPVWSPLGTRVTDSSMEYDWQEDSSKDILGKTRNTMKKPIVSQSFDPCDLDAGDAALSKIWNLAVKDQNAAALANQDVLIVHHYAGTAKTAVFAERYDSTMVKPSSLGGEGGGFVGMPIDITLGGTRTTGTASIGTGGAVTFTPDNE
uniref:Uncharacterized protein n=1 Tax=Siphoviridae sp. ctSMg55 TaxID=2825509 RepID=A0A8S5V4S5_9CAUD|nr:MAG TPA: hypothetical protein [Siphoviridae sp. ctSMg55]